MHSGELRDLLQLQTHHSFKRESSEKLPGSTDLPHLDAPPCSYLMVCLQCELLLFEWA